METKRNSRAAKVAKVRALFDNREFTEAFDTVRDTLIADIERVQIDGSEAGDRHALECVRKLHALLSVKRDILSPVYQEAILNTQTKKT